HQFLTDARVMDFPWLKRQLSVRGLVVPARARNSARSYREIWAERGSPRLVSGRELPGALRKKLGEGTQVALAMRYQNPSIESALEELKGVRELVILPLFPQYASSSTGSAHAEVMRVLSQWEVIPEVRFINSYPTHPLMIDAYI